MPAQIVSFPQLGQDILVSSPIDWINHPLGSTGNDGQQPRGSYFNRRLQTRVEKLKVAIRCRAGLR
jgi:hypothetical protein